MEEQPSLTRKRCRRNAIHPRSNDADLLREFSLQYQMRTIAIAPESKENVSQKLAETPSESLAAENKTNPPFPPAVDDDSASAATDVPRKLPPSPLDVPLPVPVGEINTTAPCVVVVPALETSSPRENDHYPPHHYDEESQSPFTPSSSAPVKKRRKTEEKEESLRSMAEHAIASASQLS